MFDVEWLPHARDRFGRAWKAMDTIRRSQLMEVAELLDGRLKRDPYIVGESRDTNLKRIAIELPLVISFRIDPRLEIVRVFTVYVFGRRSS